MIIKINHKFMSLIKNYYEQINNKLGEYRNNIIFINRKIFL